MTTVAPERMCVHESAPARPESPGAWPIGGVPISAKQFTSGKGCNNRKLSDADRAEIVRLYTTRLPDGTWMGATTIARRFHVRHPIVYRELERAGVPTRSKREAHRKKACRPVKNLPVSDPPACKCGCGESTAWNQRKNCWNRYVAGHYRKDAPYKSAVWLREQYEGRRRTFDEIAAECGVNRSTVLGFARKFGIQARDRSESRIGRMVGEKNPAWKGGVADWDYAAGWKVIARKIRDRDEWTCQRCGEQRKRWGHSLHVHHIDENKLNNDPGNLVSLCASCHRQAHREVI